MAPALLISNHAFNIGEARIVDLQSEQLLKMIEHLLKIFNLKVAVKDWIPTLYMKKYTTSLSVILSSITKNLSHGKKYGDSFSIEKDSHEETEHLLKAL